MVDDLQRWPPSMSLSIVCACYSFHQDVKSKNYTGGPVVKIPLFQYLHCSRHGFNPWLGNIDKIPHAAHGAAKKKKKDVESSSSFLELGKSLWLALTIRMVLLQWHQKCHSSPDFEDMKKVTLMFSEEGSHHTVKKCMVFWMTFHVEREKLPWKTRMPDM